VAFSFGGLFWFGARVSEIINKILKIENLDTIFKAVYLFVLSYIHPLGFNWFKPELILVHSPFGIDKPHFALFLAGMVLFLILKSKQKMVSLIFFIFSISPSNYQILPQEPEGKIYLETTWIDVRDKWKVDKIPFQIRDVLVAIDRAIANKKEAIILPESILPFFINESKIMLKELRYRSKDIDIILGGLYKNANENRNSLYFFHKGNFLVSDKVVLVPFGESNPLPDWASGWVNRLFFDGAPDYTPAKKPTDFRIAGKVYRGAICYEGTSDEIYQNIPKRLILISNNGWFYPSIEPTLQRLLLEYYVRTYHVRVYHSINYSKSYVIIPKDDKR
jgi:apolipoprotein N-acyltransferase